MENTKFKTAQTRPIPKRVQEKIDNYKKAKEEAKLNEVKNNF